MCERGKVLVSPPSLPSEEAGEGGLARAHGVMGVHPPRHGREHGVDVGHGGAGEVGEGRGGAGGAHGGVGELRGGSRGRAAGERGAVRHLVHAGALLPEQVPSELGASVLEPYLYRENT